MCGERWRKDCRRRLLPRDYCLSLGGTHLIVGRRCRIGGRPTSISAIAATEHHPEGNTRPWRRWCVGERYRRCRFCLCATTETSPDLSIPSPRVITESTPSKSSQSTSSRPINSSANSAVFNQIPPLPPSIRPAAARHTNKLPDLPSIPSLWLP